MVGTDTIRAHSPDAPGRGGQVVDATEGQDEATTPGTFAEGDATDVVTKTWLRFDVTPETADNSVSTPHVLTAEVPTTSPVNTEVDFEITGPNDPNSDGDTPGSPDRTCIVANPATNNTCTVTYTGTVVGTDTIRAWIDVDQNNTTVEADLTEGQNETLQPGSQTESDTTDVVIKNWFVGLPANAVLDCTPETATNPPTGAGSTETYTCTVVNNQGTPGDTTDDSPISGVRVDAENLNGVNDPDNSAAAGTVDFDNACTTGATGSCTFNLVASESQIGTADVCFFTDDDNDAVFDPNGIPEDGGACDTETQAGDTDPRTDVVTKTWATPAAFRLELNPRTDTNQTSQPHTVTATVFDQFGAVVPNVQVDFAVTGANAATCLNTATNASGQATCTYTGANAGTDTIRAFADVAPSNNLDDDANGSGASTECPRGGCGTEPNDTATKLYTATAPTPASIAIDMESGANCNGNQGSLNDASWESAANPANPIDTTHLVCATFKNAAGQVLLGDVTFTSSGVGHFASSGSATHSDLASPATVNTDPDGYARVYLHSTQTGTQTVTATAGGVSDTGTKAWVNAPADARVIDLTPNTATNPPGTTHQVTATVTDRFGNPVAGILLNFSETGPGRFNSGPSTEPSAINATTGTNGQVIVETTTLTSETGTQQITGTIPHTTSATPDEQCEFGANQQPDDTNQPPDADTNLDVVAGTPAGVCTETVTKTWEVPATTTTTAPGGGTTTTTAPAGGTTTTTTPGGGGGPGASGEQGYALVAADGGIFNFGSSRFFGSTGALKLNQPIVGMDHTPSTSGYWLVASDGGIFAFGDARFFGSTGAITLNRPIVGMRSTPTGNGYWLVASDGGIFAFGDAVFRGSTGAIKLNQPIVGMDRTPTGNGYWLVAADGGIFAFGDARFFGSTGAITLNRPIVGMSRTNSGLGYHLVATDGGIFAFGDAVFRGSTGAIRLNSPVTGIMPTSSGGGYWMCARDGGVFAFGNARFLGSMGATRLNQPVVGCDAPLSQGGTSV
ncbi:MAG TPA: Ig-like domain-containing protein [Acidimicrobiales bacterium]|nr:Ig-like domain-containing protein [Acidimicrobiales bacterium]